MGPKSRSGWQIGASFDADGNIIRAEDDNLDDSQVDDTDNEDSDCFSE